MSTEAANARATRNLLEGHEGSWVPPPAFGRHVAKQGDAV
jgi:hypothetical protein